MSSADVRLAPCAVARVAAWPLKAITELASPRLARQAAGCVPGGAGWENYLLGYAEAIGEERRLLWARTLEDRPFRCALAMANPALAETASGRRLPERRNKRTRHLETTLYRYLARAVARTEPNGLWAGVTLATFGVERAVLRAEARHTVTPDLSFFRALVGALGCMPAYRGSAKYKLNPTLEAQVDGATLYWARNAEGQLVQRRIAGHRVVNAVLARLAESDAWTLGAADRAARGAGVAPTKSPGLIELLCERGVLLGGLQFPCRFECPWDALAQMERLLEPEHAAAWRRAREALRVTSDTLAAALATADASHVIAAMHEATGVLEELCRAMGVVRPVLPRAPLRCDLHAPWKVVLGQADVERLHHAIHLYTAYQSSEGLGAPLFAALVRRRMDGQRQASLHGIEPTTAVQRGHSGVLTWEQLLGVCGAEPCLGARIQRGRERLNSVAADIVVPAVAGSVGEPLECMRFCLGGGDLSGALLLRSLDPGATAAFARFAHPLRIDPNARLLTDWFRDTYRKLADAAGIDLVELCFDSETPNVLCRPALWPRSLDFWGLSSRGLRVHPLRLSRQLLEERSAPVLVEEETQRPLIAFAATAATVPPDDFCLHALLMSSGRLPLIVPEGIHLAYERELSRPGFSPRVRLEDGSVVRPRRTLVSGAELGALLGARPAERFWKWQELARRYCWPALVLVHRNDSQPLLVPRDGALALEAAFEGAERENECILVEEFLADAWIGDEDDDRFHAELVLPFMRTVHTWQPGVAGASRLASDQLGMGRNGRASPAP